GRRRSSTTGASGTRAPAVSSPSLPRRTAAGKRGFRSTSEDCQLSLLCSWETDDMKRLVLVLSLVACAGTARAQSGLSAEDWEALQEGEIEQGAYIGGALVGT